MASLSRRQFLKAVGLGAAAAASGCVGAARSATGTNATAGEARNPAAKPNFVFILADDLGYNELGCYGQKKIRTPNLDRLAAQGMRFTDHYSGSPVCAPSRCTLMTGYHTGHAHVRGNLGRPRVGQLPIPDETVTLAELLKREGYRTGAAGKWGLGGPGSSGLPNKQGVDFWFGYLDQWNAHSHYPEYMWRNQEKIILEKNLGGKRVQYSHDMFTEEALKFLRESAAHGPFFLYVPYAVPHVSLHVPEDSLAEYKGKWPEKPYKGGHYSGHATPLAAYAAMITRMDRDVGRIVALLEELGVERDTLVVFTSDNGPTYTGGVDAAFFASAGPLRGLKGSVYEGGIRVPMIARWPGRIKPGATSRLPCAFWDWLPTFMDLAGAADRTPKGIDGVSIAPTLLGRGTQKRREYLYWEHHSGRGMQAVRMGPWKGVRLNARAGAAAPVQLYNLDSDIGERKDLAAEQPEVVGKIAAIMQEGRAESPYFTFGAPSKIRDEWLARAKAESARMLKPEWLREGVEP